MLKSKKYLLIGILAIIFVLSAGIYFSGIISYATESYPSFRVDRITRTHELLSDGYKKSYAIGTDSSARYYIAKYSNNGGNYPNNVLAKAFDGDFGTFWETNTVNSDSFKNYVTIEFNDAVEVDRLVFATRRDVEEKGFPKVATFSVSDDGASYEVIGVGRSEVCDNVLLYTFDKAYRFRYFRFEYTDVNANLTQHCSASEFVFFRSEEESVAKLENLFIDYNYLTLDPSYDEREISDLIVSVRETEAYRLRENLQFIADRAERALRGELAFNENRELSTAQDENGNSTIARHGDVAGYARNKLKMVWMGTNRQVTGISATPGETLTIFVESEEEDPLPTLCFTQQLGNWNKWQSGEIRLNRGINRVEVPNLFDSSWSVATNPGGPVYLRNPYTKDQQSDKVRIYIEGGYEIPTYREGDDVSAYKKTLSEYVEKYNSESDVLSNVTELQGNNVILTVTATTAKQIYVDSAADPAKACSQWDKYLKELYKFDGVRYDTEDKYYDERAEYLNVNIRVMQPYAAAYAYTEHVGIQKDTSWETEACRGNYFGWGMTHELGHMMDISERTRSEVTNNMWSQFNKTALSGEEARGDFASYLTATAPDSNVGNAYNEKASDALPWWCIESRFPGYWGNLDNCYRYENRMNIAKASELHVYFSSLAAGVDLSYYFERIGFSWGGNSFTGYDSASEEFKAALTAAKSAGRVVDDPLKLWYVDASFYNMYVAQGQKLAIYDGVNDAPKILRVLRASEGNTLMLPEVEDPAHLGYEILRGNDEMGYSVIGFTYGRTFTDTEGLQEGMYYKVKAYDRTLGSSAESVAAGVDEDRIVAKLNDTGYTTLSEALEQASEGNVIYIVDDVYESGLNVAVKNLVIKPDGKNVTLSRTTAKVLLNVESGASLTIEGTGNYTITLDGYGIRAAVPILNSAGTLTIGNNVILQNGNNSGNGGAIRITSGTLNVSGALFRDNKANNGGAIASETASSKVNIEGASFIGNVSAKNGGAIVATCTIELKNTIFEDNKADQDGGAVYIWNRGILRVYGGEYRGNTAVQAGGAFWFDGKAAFASYENKDMREGVMLPLFTENHALRGGAVYAQASRDVNITDFLCGVFRENRAQNGSALYLNGKVRLGGNGAQVLIEGYLADTGGTIYLTQAADVIVDGGNLNISASIWIPKGEYITFTSMPQEDVSRIRLTFLLEKDREREQPFAVFPDAASAQENGFEISVRLGEETFGFIIDEETSSYILGYMWKIMDGDEIVFSSVSGGSEMQLPEQAGREGYRFMGWRVGDRLYQAGQSLTVSVDTVVVAEYKKIYALHFSDSEIVLEAVEGEAVALPRGEEKEGFSFIGWKIGENSYDGTLVLDEKLIALSKDGHIFFEAEYRAEGEGTPVPGPNGGNKDNKVIIIGVSVAAVLLCGAAVAAIVFVQKRRT